MEPVPEDHEDHNPDRWSGSEGYLESYDVDYTSDEEDCLSDPEPTQYLQYPPSLTSGDATSDPYPGGSQGPVPVATPGASRTPSLGSEGTHPGCISPTPTFSSPASPSLSLSPGYGDMTLTQALALEEPLVASSRWPPAKPLPGMRVGVVARGVGADKQGGEAESSEGEEGGGCREAPPAAAVSSGIRPQGAEQADQRSAEVQQADRRRPDSHRRRQARLSHIESESERHVKETQSKCKRLALLLTDAPNPKNKGALLFKKRRQRVRRYTLVSYGTAWSDLDHEDQVAGDLGRVTASDSEPEEDYSPHRREHDVHPDGGNGEEMEGLSGTEGKGVMMFARRRQRLDEMALEQEELRSRGPPPEEPQLQNHHHKEETYIKSANLAPQHTFVDVSPQLTSQQQENIKPMTNQIPEPKPLVPNRTAKPFGVINSRAATMPSTINAPVAKKHELIFKVPVPVNTSAQVWSPTGDVIASRDERISVPAKNAGTLPGSKRRVASKQVSSDHQLQNRGDRKSYIEPEEDFFSLGAEACNFMQPRSVKLKIPPPVAPKPTINPNCQPWLSPPSEPFNPPRSPVSPSFANAPGPQGQTYAPQQDWSQFQQTPNSAPFQTTANAWAPVGSFAQNQPQPTRNSWSAQPTQSPVNIKAVSPAVSSAYPLSSSSWNKPNNVANSTASCPPQQRQPPKGAGPTPKVQGLGRAAQSQKVDGPPLMGRGAELFARRQTRMEKFVVDAETVQANQARSSSPAPSLPNSWRYSANVRAPPPLSYNPIIAPFYPPAATKQPPSTSPKIKAKTMDKPKPKKHLSSLEVMKHQPYQLDSSLFRYEAVSETQSPSPIPSPSPAPEITPIPKPRKPRSAPSHSLGRNKSDATCQIKPNAPSCSPSGMVSSPNPPKLQYTSSAEPRSPVKQLDAKPTATSAAPQHIHGKPAPSSKSLSTPNLQAAVAASLALFSPASLIARGARQMAPKPTFSAKKPMTAAFGRSYSMTLPARLRPLHSPTPPHFSGGPPGFQASLRRPPQRQASLQERPSKAPTPWEAACRSPLGSVDEAFSFQSLPASIASSLRAAGHRRSLPEPPADWTHRVALEAPCSPGPREAYCHSRPAAHATPAYCGPPFRRGGRLSGGGRIFLGFMGSH